MKHLLTGNSFLVELRDVQYGFSKVQGLKRSAELTPIREGGLNDRVHMLPAPAQQNGRVTFEHGWCVGETDFKPGSFLGECVSVQVLYPNGEPAGEFIIENAVVESWELSDLNAMESVVVVKRLSLIHGGIREKSDGAYV